MERVYVFFSRAGEPKCALDPRNLDREDCRFLCGKEVPEWWSPRVRHLISTDKVELSCDGCERARREATGLADDYEGA